MASETPRTDNPETGYRSHYAEHEHNKKLCRTLELSLQRADALLQRMLNERTDSAGFVARFTAWTVEIKRHLKGQE